MPMEGSNLIVVRGSTQRTQAMKRWHARFMETHETKEPPSTIVFVVGSIGRLGGGPQTRILAVAEG